MMLITYIFFSASLIVYTSGVSVFDDNGFVK